MAALGLDPHRYLEARDVFERTLLIQLHNRVSEIRQRMDDNLAIEIANRVGQLFKK
jgi:hypothetical protein